MALAILSTGAEAAPKAAADATAVLAEQDRVVTGGRAVQITIPQTEIATSIDAGRVAQPPSGGLLDTLIIRSLDDKREIIENSLQEKANATVAPLRQVLRDFDIDALALATTTTALSKAVWFQAQGITVTKERSLQNRSTFASASLAPQVAFITYSYDLSPDFSHMRVRAEISLANKSVEKGGQATSLDKVFYKQNISSIVQLRKRSYEHHENVASWSADDGKLAKASLTAAFSQFERLIPYAFGLAQADVKLFTSKEREKVFAAGFYGPLIEKGQDSPGNILIWSNGLVHVQSQP